jgi:hypothetical protein
MIQGINNKYTRTTFYFNISGGAPPFKKIESPLIAVYLLNAA